IYPGDILTLVYVDGKPQLRMSRGYPTVDMSPQIRVESLENAIPTIPLDIIRPFLTRAIVVDAEELDKAPYVVSSAGEHVITGVSDRVYARGIKDKNESVFDIYRPGGPYIDPDTDELLGYEALYVGTGPVEQYGDPATVFLAETTREIRVGDRLYPADASTPVTHFQPHAPDTDLEGRIISVVDGVTQIGQFNVVAIDLGTREGMEIGHVFRIFKEGALIKDTVSGKRSDTVKLPDEDAGLIMVFRTFDKVSFGLVMKATSAIHINDFVRTP
ncbi:MAG: peptidoglycan-binding protein, partial [Gammaproteobacteria bacterium]|nr:peptidoglycan-binding protein [Gammaproteobacteria bacterium]